ncbi:MAG: hypothetical protein ACON5A_00415 [Candidatus Comchoanobacterales bacterium]
MRYISIILFVVSLQAQPVLSNPECSIDPNNMKQALQQFLNAYSTENTNTTNNHSISPMIPLHTIASIDQQSFNQTIANAKQLKELNIFTKTIKPAVEKCLDFDHPEKCINRENFTVDKCQQHNLSKDDQESCNLVQAIKLLKDNLGLITRTKTCLLADVADQPSVPKKNAQKPKKPKGTAKTFSLDYHFQGTKSTPLKCYYKQKGMGFDAISNYIRMIIKNHCHQDSANTTIKDYCAHLINNLLILDTAQISPANKADQWYEYMDSLSEIASTYQQYFYQQVGQHIFNQISNQLQPSLSRDLKQLDMQLTLNASSALMQLKILDKECPKPTITLANANADSKPSDTLAFLFPPQLTALNSLATEKSSPGPMLDEFNRLATSFLASAHFNHQVIQHITNSRSQQYTMTLLCDNKTRITAKITHHDWVMLSAYLRSTQLYQDYVTYLTNEQQTINEFNHALAEYRYMAKIIREQEQLLAQYKAFDNQITLLKNNDHLKDLSQSVDHGIMNYMTGTKLSHIPRSRSTTTQQPKSQTTTLKTDQPKNKHDTNKANDSAHQLTSNPMSKSKSYDM